MLLPPKYATAIDTASSSSVVLYIYTERKQERGDNEPQNKMEPRLAKFLFRE
jgi:hypothetical protein